MILSAAATIAQLDFVFQAAAVIGVVKTLILCSLTWAGACDANTATEIAASDATRSLFVMVMMHLLPRCQRPDDPT